MIKKCEMNFNKAISEVWFFIAEEKSLVFLENKTKEIVEKYFPGCDRVFLSSFITYANALQNLFFYKKILDSDVRRYDREKRKNKHFAVTTNNGN